MIKSSLRPLGDPTAMAPDSIAEELKELQGVSVGSDHWAHSSAKRRALLLGAELGSSCY